MEETKQANILIVDDREDALMTLEATLGSLGQNLIKARSGSEALKQILKHDFAVILLDVQMPVMDGFETAKRIRERQISAEIPIIFITAGYRTEDYIFEGYAAGAVDYILKPFAPEVLRSKVRIFVDLWKKNTDLRNVNLMLEHQAGELSQTLDHLAEVRAREAARQETTLKEIHHRVKNNLQIISSLLFLQSRCVTDPATLEILKESQGRVKSIGLIHEKLYRSHDLEHLAFNDYLSDLIATITHSYGVGQEGISIHADIEKIALHIDTSIPCGLIVNELLSNVFKHAFPEGRRGDAWITLRKNPEGAYLLSVRDNGIGFPEGFDWRQSQSLGLKLVADMTRQLNGNLQVETANGAHFQITFNDTLRREREV